MKGYIYRLKDNTNGNIYYGSTIQNINKRMSKHKNHYKRYLEGKNSYLYSFEIIKNNNYNVEIVEEVECETKYELLKRERYYIENFDCINKKIPNRTYKEWLEKHKDYQKEYNKKNKEQRKEKSKIYYKNNYEKIKDYKTEKITCECGDIVNRANLSKHKKSKKHLNKTIQDT